MRLMQCEPGGLATDPAPDTCVPQLSYFRGGIPQAEPELCAAGWRDPAKLARVADACALHTDDFVDRLCGILVGYLRIIGERGLRPSPTDAEQFARPLGVCMFPGEIPAIVGTLIARGDGIADHIPDIQRGAEQRADANARYAAQSGLCEVVDFVVECPTWRDELRDFRVWTRRQKKRIARAS